MRRILTLVSFLMGLSCVPLAPTPRILDTPLPLGQGGVLARDLFRSYWLPPGQDTSRIRVGLVPHAQAIRFESLENLRLQVYSEREAFEVFSPKGTIWEISFVREIRPALIRHFAAVEVSLGSPTSSQRTEMLRRWQQRGFSKALWLGPPPMDETPRHLGFKRHGVALASFSQASEAQAYCKSLESQYRSQCRVLSRTELPPLMHATLQAPKNGFKREFEGLVHFQSQGRGGIRLHEFMAEPRVGKESYEAYSDHMFVAPSGQGGLSLIQEVPFESYLKGVVPSETFASGPKEAVNAQAVIARTYAIRHEERLSGQVPFHICASTLCQVYRGYTQRHPGSDAAVEATRDLIVWDANHRPAQTFYHSICGGHTEHGGAARFAQQPYLQGVSDLIETRWSFKTPTILERLDQPKAQTYCGAASLTNPARWTWEHTYTKTQLGELLSQAGIPGNLTDLEVNVRGVSGRALEMHIRTDTAEKRLQTEYAIRLFFGGLLSSMFELEVLREPGSKFVSQVSIRGRGYGHGVGLCQMGAIGRAELGQSFRDILLAYYPGTHVAPIDPDSHLPNTGP